MTAFLVVAGIVAAMAGRAGKIMILVQMGTVAALAAVLLRADDGLCISFCLLGLFRRGIS